MNDLSINVCFLTVCQNKKKKGIENIGNLKFISRSHLQKNLFFIGHK